MGQSGDSFDAHAEYTTDLEPQAIFDDFASQLEQQRWQVEEIMQEENSVSANLTLSTEGERWRGLLTVTEEGGRPSSRTFALSQPLTKAFFALPLSPHALPVPSQDKNGLLRFSAPTVVSGPCPG